MTADEVGHLVADALVDADLLRRDCLGEAARIAATEIEVRLALGNVIVPNGTDGSPQDGELYRRIDEVMHFIWDPIGVAGVPEARDEYGSYLARVFRLLKERAHEDQIVSYLVSVATHDMGTDANVDRAREAASVLVNWHDVLAEKALRR